MNITIHRGTLLDASWKTDLLAALHMTEWNVDTTPTMILSRASSGHPIIVLEDELMKADAEHLAETYGLSVMHGAVSPIGLGEVVLVKTGGDIARMPRTIDHLMNNGYFGKVPEEYDTAILADITLLPTRR